MFCPECGTKNHENSNFCENCGAKIIEEVMPEVHMPKQQNATESINTAEERTGITRQEAMHQENQMESVKFSKAVPKARKSAMSTARKFIIVEVILIFIIALGLNKIGSENTSPENAAIEFASNINERNWNPLYESLVLSKDKFISKEMFIKSIRGGEPISARNYKISDVEFSNGGANALMWVDFILENGESRSIQVNLEKGEEKEFLVFDSWKIVPDFIVYDFEIHAPSGAKVTLGGVELDETYLTAEDGYESRYTIPALFSGEYEIQFNLDPMENYVTTIHSQDGYFVLQNMDLSEEDQVILMENAADVFKETFEAAFAGKNFSEIRNLFTGEKTNDTLVNTLLQQEYDELVDRYALDSDVMKYLELYYLSTETDYFVEDGKINVVVYIDYEGEYEEDVLGRIYYATAYGTSSYRYEYSNNQWNITEQNLDLNIY